MPEDHAHDAAQDALAPALRRGGFADAVACRARLVELFADDARDAAAAGFVRAQLGARGGTLLWAQDRAAIAGQGLPYPLWLAGRDDAGLIHVAARDAAGVLFAMEEGLRCAGLSAVIGEIAGNPRALDFTASRRLAVASERFGVPAFLIRLNARPDLSGARMRWRVASASSLAHAWDADAPGDPAWTAELFRARGAPPGRWTLGHDRAADRLDLVPVAGDRALGARPSGA